MSESRANSVLKWATLCAIISVPLGLVAISPLLAWRDPIYIGAGFAGVIAMALLLVQPLLAIGALPGLAGLKGRRVHRWVGVLLTLSVLLHVLGLWITSPPDVIDALTFRSPTPFSLWGVIAMWALFATALLALLRRRLRLKPRIWQRAHGSLALIIVSGSILHALLIEGTMETVSKALLCVCVGLATMLAVRAVLRR